MEPIMISLKVLSTAAVMALVLPLVLPSASFAQAPGHPGASRGGHPGGGGGFRAGGGGRPGGGGPGPRFSGGGGGGGFRGGGHGGGGGALLGGAIAGAVIGGAIASQGGYGPGYYGPGPGYYDDGPVAVAPAPGGDDGVAYCMQTYRSYDPRSGTYMGNDGYRHPCP
jgi:BA14K-like protein